MYEEYRITNPTKAPIKITGLVLILVVVIILSAAAYFFTKTNKALSTQSTPITFQVQKGWSTRLIAAKLEGQGIINNPLVFKLYIILHQAGGKIIAGNYLLDRNMSVAQIVDVLTAGKVIPQDRRLTIIEGWTNQQIAQYLVARNIIKTQDEFISLVKQDNYQFKFEKEALVFSADLPAEALPVRQAGGGSASGGNYQGFLFPDTYQISKDASVVELIKKMLANFESKLTDQMLLDIRIKKLKLSDVIILSSIIEKEVGRNKSVLTEQDKSLMQQERELAASVFYNRLARGIPLESDATVNSITGKSDRQVSIKDTKIKSPYNTYLHRGLPPAAISNPGLGSIMAAIYPVSSNYLYFLNKPDGEAVFAKTLAEHNANKAKYLK